MIGVIAHASDEPAIREFFELFKTPWEFYHSGHRYDVVLCTRDLDVDTNARLILYYAGRRLTFDRKTSIGHERTDARVFLYGERRIPIYGDTVTFSEIDSKLLTDEDSHQCAAYTSSRGQMVSARVGYDLFGEIRRLLTSGQPFKNAATPTLELHIAFLRDLIIRSGLTLAEVPPLPEGYRFIVCLTHDVDHPSIFKHKWDHTIYGFLYRAVFGSLRNFTKGRLRLRDLIDNWAAASKLPFVYLGLAQDFCRKFDDGYLELEKDLSSTFFIIAIKDYSGERVDRRALRLRASRYEARDIADTIQKLMAAGCEVGLHGVDAWIDSPQGRQELDEIRRLTGASKLGVRMHWLYHDEESPAALEKMGADYDSSIGYNETVGYRAGALQAYKPLQANRLLELPLHVMDTALFYPDYLGLSVEEARTRIDRMINDAIQFGGCLTINWHDRSIFPERLWGSFYRELIEELKARGAWFSTAEQVVSWFRQRRATVFETESESEGICAKVTLDDGQHLPRLRLRIHQPGPAQQGLDRGSEGYTDIPFDNIVDTYSPATLAQK